MEPFELLIRGQVEATDKYVEGLLAMSLGENKQPDAGFYISSPATGNPWAFKVKHDTVSLWSGMTDIDGRKVFAGHTVASIVNGMRFYICFGTHQAWCPIDEQWMPTVGFYCESEEVGGADARFPHSGNGGIADKGGPQTPIGDLTRWARIVEDER